MSRDCSNKKRDPFGPLLCAIYYKLGFGAILTGYSSGI